MRSELFGTNLESATTDRFTLQNPRMLRVALNGDSCFPLLTSSEGLTDNCTWLDSQRALEVNLGRSALVPTGLQPACPFVMWRKVAVPDR